MRDFLVPFYFVLKDRKNHSKKGAQWLLTQNSEDEFEFNLQRSQK
jgi:hypothetical protein